MIDAGRNDTKQMFVHNHIVRPILELTNEQECPTLWRLYEYLTEEEKHHSLRTRRDKSNLILGEGGEGYIADDEWCYNCGSCGHWGDVGLTPVLVKHCPEFRIGLGLPGYTTSGKLPR